MASASPGVESVCFAGVLQALLMWPLASISAAKKLARPSLFEFSLDQFALSRLLRARAALQACPSLRPAGPSGTVTHELGDAFEVTPMPAFKILAALVLLAGGWCNLWLATGGYSLVETLLNVLVTHACMPMDR